MVGRAAKASCDDLLLALVCEASIAKGGLFGIQLGLEVVALGQGILGGVLLGQIVYLDQQLPCLTSCPRVTCSFLIWPDTWAPTLTCLRAFRVPSAMMSCSRSRVFALAVM